jgi:SP family sugar:H+ symporter-like MFS transporter
LLIPGRRFLGKSSLWLSCCQILADWDRTVAAEISSNPLREKTLAVGSWSGFGVGLAVGFVSPYSMSIFNLYQEPTLTKPVQNPEYAGLGGKIGFIWMAFSIISGVYVWFFLPELKGTSVLRLADQIRSKS